MPSKKKTETTPTAEERQQEQNEHIEQNRERYRAAAKLARKFYADIGILFDDEALFGTASMLDAVGDDETLAENVLRAAHDLTKQITRTIHFSATSESPSSSDINELAAILLEAEEDEDNEPKVLDALKEAREVFGDACTIATVINTYHEIYGTPEA